MTGHTTPLILAYDAACATCRRVSLVVSQSCGGRLTVESFGWKRVEEWRREAFGENPPWKPALLRPGDGRTQGWTGPAMALPLARGLGLRAALRLVYDLGQLRYHPAVWAHGTTGSEQRRAANATLAVLRFTAGTVISTRLLFTGKLPGFALNEPQRASKWAADHESRLPQDFYEIAAFPAEYRKVIYDALPAPAKSKLWVQSLQRYRAAHPEFSEEQAMVVEQAIRLAGMAGTFLPGQPAGSDAGRPLEHLRARAARAFANGEGYQRIASLGTGRPAFN